MVGRRREAGLDEFGVGGKAPTHTLDQHAVNLGSRSQESIQRRRARLQTLPVSRHSASVSQYDTDATRHRLLAAYSRPLFRCD